MKVAGSDRGHSAATRFHEGVRAIGSPGPRAIVVSIDSNNTMVVATPHL